MHRILSLGNVSKLARSGLFTKKTPSTSFFCSKRNYIRPHYYNNEPTTLSSALKKQNNPFHRIGRTVNNLNSGKVLWTLIGTNVGVYFLWQFAINSYKQFGDDHWLDFMAKNFIISPQHLSEGRIHTLITSVFSHNSLEHLGINMFVLYSFGQGVMEVVGTSRFLLLYFGAGIASSLAAAGYKAYIKPRLERSRHIKSDRIMGSMGASGSVMAVTTFFACAYPKATLLLFFVIPMPAFAVVGMVAAYDIYKASTLNTGITDSAAHIGGAAYGAGYWFLRVRPMLRAGRWKL